MWDADRMIALVHCLELDWLFRVISPLHPAVISH